MRGNERTFFFFQNGKKVEEMEETCSCKGTFWSSVLSISSMFSFINCHVKGDWCLLLQKSPLENIEAQVTLLELHACRNLHKWLTGHMHLFVLSLSMLFCHSLKHTNTHAQTRTHARRRCLFPKHNFTLSDEDCFALILTLPLHHCDKGHAPNTMAAGSCSPDSLPPVDPAADQII